MKSKLCSGFMHRRSVTNLSEDFYEQIQATVNRDAAHVLSIDEANSWNRLSLSAVVGVKGKKVNLLVCFYASRKQRLPFYEHVSDERSMSIKK